MKKHLGLVLRLIVTAAGLTYIICTVDRGIFITLRDADWPRVVLGLVLVLGMFPIQSLRWYILMRARGLPVSFARTFRLSMVGLFFNLCMPGTIGGDLPKAYYVARHSDRRVDAVMSVLADRITGLLGLLLLGCITGLFLLDQPIVREPISLIWAMAGAVVVFGTIYFSKTIRGRIGFDWLLARLPGKKLWASVDQAATAYRDHPRTVLAAISISIGPHIMLAFGTALAGKALGLTWPMIVLLPVIPMLYMVAAIPISIMGLGVMELVAVKLLAHAPYADENQVIGMVLLARGYLVLVGLIGSLFLIRGDINVHSPEPQDPE